MRKNTKILCCFVMLSLLTILSGCKKKDTLGSNFTLLSEGDKIAGTITVSKYTDLNYQYFKRQVKAFQRKYPDVEVIVNEYDDQIKYADTIKTKLLNGIADDIIDATAIDYYNMADNGYLVNYYDLMDLDKSFNIDDYYQNVFEAFAYKKSLYLFPVNYIYSFIGGNKNVSPELVDGIKSYDSIDYFELIDLHKMAGNHGENKYYLTQSTSLINPICTNINKYIDFENKTCDFNNQEFIQLLNDYYNNSDPERLLWYGYIMYPSYIPNVEIDLSGKYNFLQIQSMNLQYFMPYEFDYFNYFVPIVNEKGKIDVNFQDAFIINRKSDNKALAWEFIKFLTSEEANDLYTPSYLPIPIKKDVFRKTYEEHGDRQIDFLEKAGLRFNNELLESTNKSDIINKAVDIIGKINEREMQYSNSVSFVSIFIDELIPFVKRTITAEDAAANIQNKVHLKLNE